MKKDYLLAAALIVAICLTAVMLGRFQWARRSPGMARREKEIEELEREVATFASEVKEVIKQAAEASDPVAEFVRELSTNPVVGMTPEEITELPDVPKTWEDFRIDRLKMYLPFKELHSVTNRMMGNTLRFRGGNGFNILVSSLAWGSERKPDITFAIAEKTERTLPTDLAKTNSLAVNEEVLERLRLKAMKTTGTYWIGLVETKKLNAVVWKRRSKGDLDGVVIEQAVCEVFSKSDDIQFDVFITNAKDEEFCLKLLSGISFSGKKMDAKSVEEDVAKFCRSWNRK